MTRKNIHIIAIETTGPRMSIALNRGDITVDEYRPAGSSREHSERLVAHLGRLMKDNGLAGGPDALAVDVGPGSFTGIRVGLALAKTLAHAWNIPLAGVPSLDILAAGAGNGCGNICCMIDALRGEVFAAVYRQDKRSVRLGDYRLAPVDEVLNDLPDMDGKVLFVGNGAVLHRARIRFSLGDRAVFARPGLHSPRASFLAQEALRIIQRSGTFHYEKVQPLYLRRLAAEERRLAKK